MSHKIRLELKEEGEIVRGGSVELNLKANFSAKGGSVYDR